MDQMQRLRLSVTSDERTRRCRLSAELPTNADSGLRGLSFVFYEHELEQFARAECFVGDITHHIRAFGDSCLFFDLEFPSAKQGRLSVPYYQARIPLFVRRLLLRFAKRAWRTAHQADWESVLEFRPETVSRWIRNYGVGTGTVRTAINELTQPAFEQRLSEPNSNFKDQLDRLIQIAKNRTSASHQEALLRLSKDWDGFYFEIFTPRGDQSLNGGLVDHGRGGPPSWSIHT